MTYTTFLILNGLIIAVLGVFFFNIAIDYIKIKNNETYCEEHEQELKNQILTYILGILLMFGIQYIIFSNNIESVKTLFGI